MSDHYDLEEIYDSEIFPLMDQIIKVCYKHKLPMIASFAYLQTSTPRTFRLKIVSLKPSEINDK